MTQWSNWFDWTALFDLERGTEQADFFMYGVAIGLEIALAAILLLGLIVLFIRRKKRYRGITMTAEDGNLFISVNAIREFVERLLNEFSEASLNGVRLKEKKRKLILSAELDTLPDTQIQELAQELRARIISEAKSRLGIDQPLSVDITVRSLSASEKKIARRARRSGTQGERSRLSNGQSIDGPEPEARESVPLWSEDAADQDTPRNS